MISIIVLFCDKDVKYLKSCLSMIDAKCHFKHEVIIVDNRTNDKSELPEGNYKYINPGHNVYLFEGRRCGLDAAIGEFVWNIDVDDEIPNDLYDSDFSQLMTDSDMIQANYIMEYFGKDNEVLTTDVTYINGNLAQIGWNVWSRLYRASFLRRILLPIRRGIDMVANEDHYLLSLVLDNNPRIKVLNKIIYKYKQTLSTQFGKPDLTEDQRKSLLQVGEDNWEYLCSFLSNGDAVLKSFKILKQITK